MNQRVDHIGIAVKDMAAEVSKYTQMFGIEPLWVRDFAERSVRIAVMQLGEIQLHLLAPLEPGAGPVWEFLRTHGEGVHHIGLQVNDLEQTMATFDNLGMPMPDKIPIAAPGGRRVAFNNPKFTQNVLFELFDTKGR